MDQNNGVFSKNVENERQICGVIVHASNVTKSKGGNYYFGFVLRLSLDDQFNGSVRGSSENDLKMIRNDFVKADHTGNFYLVLILFVFRLCPIYIYYFLQFSLIYIGDNLAFLVFFI